MSRLALTPEQQVEADRIAELLASKLGNRLLGRTEHEVRDHVL